MVDELRLIAYCRVSTDRQKDKQTIEQQVEQILDYLKYHDNIRIIKWYKDDGVSGFDSKRPAYTKMLEKLVEVDVDGIIILKLDRLGRSSKELLRFADILKDNNKQIVSIKENIDTFTPSGRAFFGMLSVMAQFEAENIIEKLAYGRRKYIEAGGKLGRKKKVMPENIKKKMIKWYIRKGFGFSIIQRLLKDEKYEILNKEGKLIEMKGFYLSPTTIGERLKEWGVEIRNGKKERGE